MSRLFEENSRSLIIAINDKCPLHCSHCSLGYGADRMESNRRLTEAELRNAIRAAAGTGIFNMLFLVGGEPSLEPGLLSAGIEESHLCGLQKNAVVTAPIWASSRAGAQRFLSSLPGFEFLILSYDSHHLAFLDLDHYENAIDAACDLGIKVSLNICYSLSEERIQLVRGITHLLDRISSIQFQDIIPLGNAAAPNNISYEGTGIDTVSDLSRLKRTCRIGDVFISPEKKVTPCCWAPENMDFPFRYDAGTAGDFKSAFDSMERDQDFIRFSRAGFMDHIDGDSAKALVDAVKGMSFVNECHLCLYLMSQARMEMWNVCLNY